MIIVTKEQLGHILKDLRSQTNYSTSEVVKRLQTYGIDISEKTLYSYEIGNSSPKISVFFRLCEIYGVDNIPATFGFEAEEKPATKNDDGLSEAEAAMLKLFRMVPAESQELVFQMIEAALKSQGLL